MTVLASPQPTEKKPPPPPTEEQIEILDYLAHEDGNFMVNAYAGTGKTTTLGMIQAASKRQPVICVAFNRRAADEMIDRFPPDAEVKTFNGCGHGVWNTVTGGGRLPVDAKKTSKLVSELIQGTKGDDRRELSDNYWEICKAIDLAKNLGYVPPKKYPQAKRLITREEFHARLEETPTEFFAGVVDNLLVASIKGAYERWIDFNDQIYMPTLFGGPFPRFPLVLIDEVQDLNPVNHEMSRKLVTDRLGAVGDPWQSIYAFRGAVQEGMAKMGSKFSCRTFDLSVSFRCPQAVVEAARWRVPQFKWVKPGGHYEVLQTLPVGSIPDNAAILCRNNAPLFKLGLELLGQKRSVQVAGSDIGFGLVRLLQKIGDERDDSEALISKIEAWANDKLAKSRAPENVMDMAECLKIFAGFGANLVQAVAYAKNLFAQQGAIQLSTGHKAKGLEWDVVYHLDPWLLKSDDQDLNLKYVIQTRAKDRGFEIDSRGIQW